MKIFKVAPIALFSLFFHVASAQFTHLDSLRGSNGPGRSWWHVTQYDLHITLNFTDSTITGLSNIRYNIVKGSPVTEAQIDLQQPLMIDSAFCVSNNVRTLCTARREGNAYFLSVPQQSAAGQFQVYYHGKPHIARRPPWDGGLIWTRDKNNDPWVSVASQSIGSSIWYPCKDYQGDKADSAAIHITAPSQYVSVANGKLQSTKNNNDSTCTYNWTVSSPINNYCIVFYTGKYVNFKENYKGEKGNLDLSYWVLSYNLDKAKEHFKEGAKVIQAFEHWFGPYPFYKDSYKLVEAPYVGMENQSAIAYGNGYIEGYTGRDRSGSGWGKKWDFMIVHESAHEWFGNNITAKDIADLWVHESFASYAESLYTEFQFGKPAGEAYCIGVRKEIANDFPSVGVYGVNDDPSSRTNDMYWKGANMLQTIRQVINNDEKFRSILRGLNSRFYHSTVYSKDIEDYFSAKAGRDLSPIFNQYLRTKDVPELTYAIKGGTLTYKWTNCVKGFNMPINIQGADKRYFFIYPTEKEKTIKFKGQELLVDDRFYIRTVKAN